jgi:hypothetical protein
MYRIRREDLDAYFQAQVDQLTGREPTARAAAAAGTTVTAMPGSAPVKCSLCYRLLASDDGPAGAPAGVCAAPGCAQPLCRACLAAGHRHCAAHQPRADERLAAARDALARGEIARLVTGADARQLEQAWLARFEARMADIASFYHPTAGEVLRIDDWAPFREREDEALQLMRLLNAGFLDRATQAALPHNARARYVIERGALGRGKPARGLIVEARFAARLEQYVAAGFDTQPAQAAELAALLAELEAQAARRDATVIAGLAAPTGWEDAAAARITDARGRAYRHPDVLPFLVDLERGAVTGNALDERLAAFGFAELFKLPLEAEEVAAVAGEIEAALLGREGLAVSELARLLDRPAARVLAAAAEVARRGRYQLVDESELGPTLLRSRE